MNNRKEKRKLQLYNCEIKPTSTPGELKMVLTGRNSADSDVEITVTMEDYFLKYMHADMIKYANEKIRKAVELRDAIVKIQ